VKNLGNRLLTRAAQHVCLCFYESYRATTVREWFRN